MSDKQINGGDIEFEFESGGTTSISDVESLELETNGGLETISEAPDQLEYSFSCEFEIPTQEVVCPDCGVTNHLPNGPFLHMATDGPEPCVMCGYPLL
jgi:hypothetical protein